MPQDPSLTLIFTHFFVPVSVIPSRVVIALAILQARIHALDQLIGHNITCAVEDAQLGTMIRLTFLCGAEPTWGMWFDVANALLVFLERYEYVESMYKVQNDEGVVVGVGELAYFP